MKLGLLASAWLVGTIIGLRLDPAVLPLALLILAAIASGVMTRFCHWPLWPVVMAAVVLVAATRVTASDNPLMPLTSSDGQTVTIQGRVVNEPEATQRFFKLEIEADGIDRGSGFQPFSSRVLVFAEPPPALVSLREPPYFRYGDQLLIEGQVRLPRAFAEFDYDAYLANQGISGVIYSRSALLSDPSAQQERDWRSPIFDLRGRVAENLEDALPERHSGIGQALLLGKRGRLPGDLVEDFRSTGTSHILAISGLHIGLMMILGLGLAPGMIGRRWNAYLIVPLALIWVYALISGESPSAIRAAIMGTVYIAALLAGRPSSTLPALSLAAAAMVALDPHVLQQASFQFSVGAMAGIALVMPFQERVGMAIAAWSATNSNRGKIWLGVLMRWFAASIIVSIGATLATWPLVAFNFDRIPVLGIFTTALASPVLPLILFGTLGASLGGLVHPLVGQIFGWLDWVPISYLMELVARFPSFTVSGSGVGSWMAWPWYPALAVVILSVRARGHLLNEQSLVSRLIRLPVDRGTGGSSGAAGLGKTLFAMTLVSAIILVWTQVFSGPDGKLHVYYLDVGQGDSVLIVTPEGRQILVDGGPGYRSATAALSERLPGGDRSLDMVALTHLDSDHSRGLLEVLDRHHVGSVLFGPEDIKGTMYPQWRSMIDREDAVEILAQAGHQVILEPGIKLQVLNPPEQPVHSLVLDPNNDGVVLKLVYGEVSFLLTTDIESLTENRLVRSDPALNSTVLKVAQHGSRTSTTPAFLASVAPLVGVISVGATNSFGHPVTELLDRLDEAMGEGAILRTDRDGTVEFKSDGQALWFNTER